MLVIDAAGLRVGLDVPSAWIDSGFLPFACDGQPKAVARMGQEADLIRTGGETYELEEIVTVWPDAVRMVYREESPIKGTMLRLTGEIPEITVVCEPTVPAPALWMDAVKGSVYLLLQKRGVYLLHSASVILDGRVYAFSAPSGMGKSTHAALWRKLYGAEDFNGDLLALRAGEIPVMAHGIPWSGSSGITRRAALPLGGVFFLERAEKNRVEPLAGMASLILLCRRLFADHVSPGALTQTMNAMAETAKALPCAKLYCTMEDEACRLAVEYARSVMRDKEIHHD